MNDFLNELSRVVEVDASDRRRAEYSSDASNYRVRPLVVAFPRNKEQAEEAAAIARAHSVPLTNRGAGTSVAGNAIGTGLVLDFSRHMNAILEVDPSSRTARVEPGVIMTDLQAASAPFGLWFGPDPSTKNRATLGGMIGNNACGPHALAYGKTSDNVVSLEVIDGQGRRFTASSGSDALQAVPGLQPLVNSNLAILRTELGRFDRQVSGYSLEHLLPEKGTNLAKALVGTEGTCVTVLEATVQLQPLPDAKTLVVLGYANMVSAATDITTLLPHAPLAIEGIDARLVEVVRSHTGNVPDLPKGTGWLFCEVGGKTQEESTQAAHALAVFSNAIDYRVVTDSSEEAALWRIRADGVGLAGRTPSGKQAWPGWEDAAVPPHHLGAYLQDFEDLLSEYGVEGLPYGHFGDGCIHVRIGFPLERATDVDIFGTFMKDAARLVGKYGGSTSGEHGDGRARSELLPFMSSQEARPLFSDFKGLFDPENTLNPGVLVKPAPITANLRRPQAKPIKSQGFAFTEDGADFTAAVHRCVGVGKCRADNFGIGGFMCPSYQATNDEKDVTRGRARVLQDLAAGGFQGNWGSPEVADSLDLCLSCKACGRDCPAGVDMSMYKSEATYRRYKGKLRPMNHYVLGWLPRWAKLVTAVPGLPKLANWAMGIAPIRQLVFAFSGIDSRRQMTAFSPTRFSSWFQKAIRSEAPQGNHGQDVILWADSFSENLDPTAAQNMVALLQRAGYKVRIPSSSACCGLTWISTGQLDGAKKKLRQTLDILGPAALKGVPIIGVEPSCTAVLRGDLTELLPEDPRSSAVKKMTMTLAELLSDARFGPDEEWFEQFSLEGTTVIAQPHCHHYAVMGYQKDIDLLAKLGAKVTTLAGCCGLAGNFGMEKGHYEVSVAVASNALLPALENAPADAVFLADGYSCRTQAEQLANWHGVSLAELLVRKL